MHEIRNQRKRLGLSLRQLAADCEVSLSYVARFERGERGVSPEVWARLRARLGLCVEEVGAELSRDVVYRLKLPTPPVTHSRRADAWARVLQCHRGLLRQLKGPALPRWFREECDCDSSPEHVGLASLLAVGAETGRASP